MVALPYVGKTQANPTDLVNRSYVTGLLAANLSQATVDSMINDPSTGLGGYSTKAYVDSRDALNATRTYIDAGDATRLSLGTRNQNNGVAGLDSTGRVDISRVQVAPTQRWPRPFISPSAYHGSPVSITAETQLYTCAVADPMFNGIANSPYKLLVTGVLDASTNTDGEYAVVRVRQGNATTGQVVAGGYGLGETYVGGVVSTFSTAGTSGYSIPPWAVSLDVIVLGAGGGGQDGFVFFFVPFSGAGGLAGTFSTATLTRGGNLPGGTSSLSVTVGAGGLRNAVGASSSVTGTGVTAITAAGGASGNGGAGAGASPGDQVYHGQTYVGGTTQATLSAAGNAPGGGGGGGTPPGSGPGGLGADGAVWIFAYPNPSVPSGPVDIIPHPFNAQTAITGATTLYVTAQRSGAASTQSVSTILPGLFVVPVPA